MKKILSVVSVVILGACEKDALVVSELERLDNFRNMWYAQEVHTYEITQEISCYCPREYTVPKVLQVENNRLVAVNGGPYIEEHPTEFLTINEAFDFIEERLLENPAEARIFYDGTYGFPYLFYFDMDDRIVDEEIEYSFSDFNDFD